MKELYNAPKAEVISFVSQQAVASAWTWGKIQLSLNIDFLTEEDEG